MEAFDFERESQILSPSRRADPEHQKNLTNRLYMEQ
jgi:hypothetical protein